jgi:uncharacterized membrane protein YeaQ/YmgE (transglycosylase-associated protein family)
MDILILVVVMVVVGLIIGALAGPIWKGQRPIGVQGDYIVAVLCTVIIEVAGRSPRATAWRAAGLVAGSPSQEISRGGSACQRRLSAPRA